MTEVGFGEFSRLLQTKRHECSSIVTSRKRKLRELFAVATQVESLPHDVLANPDAPTTTAAEWQFLQSNDIFQGKAFNESNLPPRPKFSLETLTKSLASVAFKSAESAAGQTPDEKPKDESVTEQRDGESRKPVLHKELDNATTSPEEATPIASTKSTPTTTPTPTPTPTPTASAPKEPTERDVSEQTSPIEATRPVAQAKPAEVPATSPASPDVEMTDADAPIEDVAEAKKVQEPTPASQQPDKISPPEPILKQPTAVPEESVERTAGDMTATSGVEAKPLPIQLPADKSHAQEAASSPASTTQTATTPTAQDISTDTSPDNEANHFAYRATETLEQEVKKPKKQEGQERNEKQEKQEKTRADPGGQPSIQDLQKQALEAPPDTAEAQLLQESIRSSVAAEKAAAGQHKLVVEPTVATTEPAGTSAVATTDQEATVEKREEKDSTQTPISSEAQQSLDGPKEVGVPPKEIPDSQEEAPDKMEVDEPEVSRPVEAQIPAPIVQDALPTVEAPTTENQNPPASEAPAVPTERPLTRVASGAIKPKSVSEIIGDVARSVPPHQKRPSTSSFENRLTPVTSTPKSPSSHQKSIAPHKRNRSRGQIPTVVFGKKPKRAEEKAVVPTQREPIRATDDYYSPLFVQGFTGSSSWMQPIDKLLFTANKTVSTPDVNLAIQDHQACKVLRRVYHLQQHDKWALRQPKRCPEPTRPPSHWDVLLDEVKWMRTDFRGERKWKMAVARKLAYACAEWHESCPEERKALQVPAVIPPKTQPAGDVSMMDIDLDGMENLPTPDLIPSADFDSPMTPDALPDDFVETVAPSAIFSLQSDEVVFGLRRTPSADRLLEELPLYGSPLKVPKFDLTGPEYDPDAHWRRPALPLSKYVEGQMKLVSAGPPRKRSRYDYRNEDSDDEEDSVFADGRTPKTILPPKTTEVALFNPEMKHIRDRLHAGHQFRPPTEHIMPAQSFYENRIASQWTVAEEDELKCLVREYSYNWSLISSILTTKSMFSSGAERRTPWECFERWINLEGLPADMQKTQYFKTYNTRIEAAQRVIMQANQMAAQQASASGGAVALTRRRPSTPMRVERRRNQKHLALFDAMRKLAKKRETAAQKQQHTASQNANNKKNNDVISQRPTRTPREYSLMRWERDQALAEKMAQFAQRQEAQRRAAAMQARQGQAAQMAAATGAAPQAMPNAGHPNAAVVAAAAAAAANGMNGVGRVPPNQLAAAAAAAAAAAQGRRMPMQAPGNGMPGMPAHMAGALVPPGQMNGIPQAQMQAAMQGQAHRMPMPNPQPDVNLMLRAQRISEQQRAAVQMQQAQQQQQGVPSTPSPMQSNQQSPPPNMRASVNGVNGVNGVGAVNGMSQQAFINNAQAMMASYAANANNHATQANGLHMPSGPAGSPGARPMPQYAAGIATQFAALEAQFRMKNPNLTPEQIRALATEHLTRAVMQQRQTAMNAAAGANGQPGLATNIAATTSPHQYAALLRQQQQQQASVQASVQAAGSPVPPPPQQPPQHQRQASGSATPSAK